MKERTLGWLEAVDFYAHTGMPPENVYTCGDRAGKAPICRQLKLTHFVDDRIDVLEFLRRVVPNLFLFGAGEQVPRWATRARDWTEVLERLRKPGLRLRMQKP